MYLIHKIKNFFTSKSYGWILWVFAEVILLAIVFALGVRVGLHKAKYSYEWGANYERNFMDRQHDSRGFERPGGLPMGPGGPMNFLVERRGDFRNAHGLAGNIISIAENTIVVKDRDNKENTVSVSEKTIIKSGRDNIKIDDLKTDDEIVIIGKPDSSGVIKAELIRIFNNNSNPQPQK